MVFFQPTFGLHILLFYRTVDNSCADSLHTRPLHKQRVACKCESKNRFHLPSSNPPSNTCGYADSTTTIFAMTTTTNVRTVLGQCDHMNSLPFHANGRSLLSLLLAMSRQAGGKSSGLVLPHLVFQVRLVLLRVCGALCTAPWLAVGWYPKSRDAVM